MERPAPNVCDSRDVEDDQPVEKTEVDLAGWKRRRQFHVRVPRRLDSPREVTPHGIPILLTVDEAAGVLRTSRRAIYVMIERRQLPGLTRIGRRVLVRSADLLDWLEQKRTPSARE